MSNVVFSALLVFLDIVLMTYAFVSMPADPGGSTAVYPLDRKKLYYRGKYYF